MICSIFYAALLLSLWVITKNRIWILYKMIWKWLWWLYATVRYPSTEQSKYSNCTVTSKYGKENQVMHFHHHHQAHLIHYFCQEQMPLIMHMIQCRILVKPGYFINWVRPAWPGQNVTQLIWITRMTRSGFNPGSKVR